MTEIFSRVKEYLESVFKHHSVSKDNTSWEEEIKVAVEIGNDRSNGAIQSSENQWMLIKDRGEWVAHNTGIIRLECDHYINCLRN